MNRKQVRKASQALDAAREVYEKAAEDFLAAVEATPAEIEAATKIIFNDLVANIQQFPYESLSYNDRDSAEARIIDGSTNAATKVRGECVLFGRMVSRVDCPKVEALGGLFPTVFDHLNELVRRGHLP